MGSTVGWAAVPLAILGTSEKKCLFAQGREKRQEIRKVVKRSERGGGEGVWCGLANRVSEGLNLRGVFCSVGGYLF